METSSRGKDATGFAYLNPKDGILWFDKAPLAARPFLRRDTLQRSVLVKDTNLLIGHCRWATHGDAKENKNNHPHFSRDGRLAIVHNGVIWCHDWLSRDEKLDAPAGECDSEQIAHLLASRLDTAPGSKSARKSGILDCVETLDDYQGDFAVAALDQKSRVIWLFRNDHNPLFYVRIPSLGITLFASEADHIHAAVCGELNKRMRKRFGYKKSHIFSLHAGQVGLIRQDGSMTFSKRVAPLNERTKVQYGTWQGAHKRGGYTPYVGYGAHSRSSFPPPTTTYTTDAEGKLVKMTSDEDEAERKLFQHYIDNGFIM